MKKLSTKSLIAKANETYSLGLDEGATDELFNRMRRAGFGTEIISSKASEAIDTILVMQKQIATGAPQAIYADLKVEADLPSDDHCPRCKGGIRRVLLVGKRQANYCQACGITLPVKVEE
jgi:hypothetical protein